MFRVLRAIATRVGLIRFLDAHRDHRLLFWLRSLFAIYNAADMLSLGTPWWTFKAIDAVDQFLADRPQARVFEYGAGASTFWLAQRAKTVFYVEHDAQYQAFIEQYAGHYPNIQGRLIEPRRSDTPQYTSSKPGYLGLDFQEYVAAISTTSGPFDLIVIDGRCRERCLEMALPYLSEGGCILFDDTWRQRYKTAIVKANLPFQVKRGLTPCLPYPSESTLIFSHTH